MILALSLFAIGAVSFVLGFMVRWCPDCGRLRASIQWGAPEPCARCRYADEARRRSEQPAVKVPELVRAVRVTSSDPTIKIQTSTDGGASWEASRP